MYLNTKCVCFLKKKRLSLWVTYKKIYNKQIVGLTGSSGILGKYFVKKYKKKFIFKPYRGRIENVIHFKNWIKKNKNIDFFLHFAALASVKNCEKNNKMGKTNVWSPVWQWGDLQIAQRESTLCLQQRIFYRPHLSLQPMHPANKDDWLP